MDDFISREAVISEFCDGCMDKEWCKRNGESCSRIKNINAVPASDVRPVPEGGIGEMSDGYHTFNGLYYQRMVLFASLVNAHQDKAWKSWKHEDGKPCFDGGWFIVGIDTPQGSYTYHYEDKYWNWFECEELPVAKHWDGHTEEDVTRLMSLDVRPMVRGHWIEHISDLFPADSTIECDQCHAEQPTGIDDNFCPNCGADMRETNLDITKAKGDNHDY